MKLLLDENLSRRLVPFLQEVYPGSTQVTLIGLERADDLTLWRYAHEHGFVIVTKDIDYYDLSLIHGAPPHVIWIQTGNTDKTLVLKVLIDSAETIQAAFANGMACVELGT
jgi:predicted nuclease of predicted toxin-antitoxin system